MCHIFSQLDHCAHSDISLTLITVVFWRHRVWLKKTGLFSHFMSKLLMLFDGFSLWVYEDINPSSYIFSVAQGRAELRHSRWVVHFGIQSAASSGERIARCCLSSCHSVHSVNFLFNSDFTVMRYKSFSVADILQHANCWWYSCDLSSNKCRAQRGGCE